MLLVAPAANGPMQVQVSVCHVGRTQLSGCWGWEHCLLRQCSTLCISRNMCRVEEEHGKSGRSGPPCCMHADHLCLQRLSDTAACGLRTCLGVMAGAPGRNCSTYDTCYDCQGASNCVWCFEGLPGRGQKPSCQPSTASCGRRVSSRSDCPVDGTAGRAGTTAAEAGVTCASLSNCRQCLRYTYQCRWCITGEA